MASSERELCPVDGVRAICCGIGPVEAAPSTARALAVLHETTGSVVPALRRAVGV